MNTSTYKIENIAREILYNKYGISKLDISIYFLTLIEGGKECFDANYNAVIDFLQTELKRKLTQMEITKMGQGLIAFIKSELGTNERLNTMDYLFNLEFLSDNDSDKRTDI